MVCLKFARCICYVYSEFLNYINIFFCFILIVAVPLHLVYLVNCWVRLFVIYFSLSRQSHIYIYSSFLLFWVLAFFSSSSASSVNIIFVIFSAIWVYFGSFCCGLLCHNLFVSPMVFLAISGMGYFVLLKTNKKTLKLFWFCLVFSMHFLQG